MERKKGKGTKHRSGIVVAMCKRYPRTQTFRHRTERRAKDYKNSWKREWE